MEREYWEVTVKLVIPKSDYENEYEARNAVAYSLVEVLNNYNISSMVYDDMQ